MTGTRRLSMTTLPDRLPDAVDGPVVDPSSATVGIVHLGVGAFHRSHQAVFTEDAAGRTGDTGWGVLGVAPRSRRVVGQLVPQDCLYGVLTKGAHDTSLRIIGSVRDAAYLHDETERVLAAIAAPTTHVVSLTVSEKGYRRDPSGSLDPTDHGNLADIAALRSELAGGGAAPDAAAATTPIGVLARGLVRRFRDHGAPVTVLSCDNMVGNGRVVARLVRESVESARTGPHAAAPGLDEWLARTVRWPGTMVDRITPTTTDAHRREATALLGLHDDALVVAEPFSQWVIEDDLAETRPRWELAGATISDDVAAYERVKLRMLNGSHSSIAYLGALLGHATIDRAMDDDAVVDLVHALMDDDVVPTLSPPAELDVATYRDQVLRRFANPATGYATLQVAADGSQKVPIRLLGTIEDRLAAGAMPEAAIRAVAAWIVFVARRRDRHGRPLALDDPIAEQLVAAADGPDRTLTDRMLALDVFPARLRDDPAFRTGLAAEVADLLRLIPAT